jgi:hypothetical protein
MIGNHRVDALNGQALRGVAAQSSATTGDQGDFFCLRGHVCRFTASLCALPTGVCVDLQSCRHVRMQQRAVRVTESVPIDSLQTNSLTRGS